MSSLWLGEMDGREKSDDDVAFLERLNDGARRDFDSMFLDERSVEWSYGDCDTDGLKENVEP